MVGLRGVEWTLGDAMMEVVQACAGVTLNAHSHETPHLLLMVSGALHEDGRVLRSGDLRISPARDRHFVRFDQSSTCLLVHLRDSSSQRAAERIVASVSRPMRQLATRLRDVDILNAPVPEEAWEILSGMVAVARRAEDEQASSRVPTWLKELRSYVSTRPEEVRRVSMLATRAGVSREHLTRAYRQHYGAPISDFLRNARMIQAYDRVVESRVPLSDISSSCGFADQSHMTRLFVKQFGVSPAALRSCSANITTVQEIQPTR